VGTVTNHGEIFTFIFDPRLVTIPVASVWSTVQPVSVELENVLVTCAYIRELAYCFKTREHARCFRRLPRKEVLAIIPQP